MSIKKAAKVEEKEGLEKGSFKYTSALVISISHN